jgi:hypothetical protein
MRTSSLGAASTGRGHIPSKDKDPVRSKVLNETTAATAVKLKRKRPKQDATHLTKNNTTGLSTNNEH